MVNSTKVPSQPTEGPVLSIPVFSQRKIAHVVAALSPDEADELTRYANSAGGGQDLQTFLLRTNEWFARRGEFPDALYVRLGGPENPGRVIEDSARVS